MASERLLKTPAVLATLPLVVPVRSALWTEYFFLKALAIFLSLVQGVCLLSLALLRELMFSGNKGVQKILFGSGAISRAASVPAPSTPPSVDDEIAGRPSFAIFKSFGSLPFTAPSTPRITVSRIVSKDYNTTSPSSRSVVSDGGASSASTELDEDRRRLRLLKIKAEKLAGKSMWRNTVTSFPLKDNTVLLED